MNFVNYNKIIADTKKFAKTISYDAVFAIPRSGVVPGAIFALEQNIPLGIVGQDKVLQGGWRDKQPRKVEKIVVIDDSLHSGVQMEEARKFFSKLSYDTKYVALYITPGEEDKVDYYFEQIPLPRMFEWNFIHHGDLARTCLDIDGVLADNEITSEEAFREAEPLYLPTVPVGTIVTGRLEQYREVTENWLRKYEIKYDALIMRENPKMPVEVLKANFYGSSKYIFFIESSDYQAVKIAEMTGKPVLSTESMRVW